jgi:Serine hydrolase (FSH1)
MNYRSESRLAPCLRILCLHDTNSNASQLSDQLEELGERLYEKHAIDLVYVNSPLLKADPDFRINLDDLEDLDDEEEEEENADGNNIKEEQKRRHRRRPKIDPRGRVWWEDASAGNKKKNNNNEPTTTTGDDSVDADADTSAAAAAATAGGSKYLALDASLLLMRQVWNSMPFWGVLGVGDGAAVASFLPLLPVDPMPAFGIFVHGTTLLDEEERLIDAWPSLHIVGTYVGH